MCGRNCVVIPAKHEPVKENLNRLKRENLGFCGVRANFKGKLFSLNYGLISSLSIDPIEKKPLYHFLPGTKILSLGSFGCNFRCPNCQNWQISQAANPNDGNSLMNLNKISSIKPAEIVSQAIEYNIPSIAYTYNEPTVFTEFALDVMKLAKKAKIKNVWVSNGFFSKETLKLISPYLDAINVDLKSFDKKFYLKYCKGRLNRILNNMIAIKKKDIHLEITTLIIPGLTDNEQMIREAAKFIKKRLSPTTPWHLTNFVSDISWKMSKFQSASKEELVKAYETAKEEGLKYVYAGTDELNHTYCPNCGTPNIIRWGYDINRFDKVGYCNKCREKLEIK